MFWEHHRFEAECLRRQPRGSRGSIYKTKDVSIIERTGVEKDARLPLGRRSRDGSDTCMSIQVLRLSSRQIIDVPIR